MSVFTKEAFQMSSIPAGSMQSRPGSGAATPQHPVTTEPESTTTTDSSTSSSSKTSSNVVEIDVEACLFDMDGTLLNSSPAVNKAWNLFAQTYTLDLEDILRSAHGMRTIDVLRKWCKIEDPKLLESEVVRFESAILAAAQTASQQGGAGIEVLPGVASLLDSLSADKDHESRGGKEMWAICTSSTFFYAGKAIPIAGLTTPKVFVTAESVTRGKPAPDPYLTGAEGCGASIFECVVFEDAPTGIKSGKASGARVIATCTSHEREELEKEKPDFLVEDLSHVTAKWNPETGRFRLVIDQPADRREVAPTPDQTPIVTPAMSRASSFGSVAGERDRAWFKAQSSDELTGADSVVGSPAGSTAHSRAGSPSPEDQQQEGGLARKSSVRQSSGSSQTGGISLDAFKRALAGNAQRTQRRPSVAASEGELANDE